MTSPTPQPHKATWIKRAKLGVAGAALAALAVFGGMGAMDAPDTSPQPEEEAGGTWSFTGGGGHGKGGPGAGTHGATWS